MRVVRSPVPHGILRGIDASAAKAMPGVLAVWSASDVGLGPIEFRQAAFAQLRPYRQPVLARTRLRYVGEPVAVVFAQDPYLAEDAADLVAVEIEDLPATLSADHPPGEFSPGRSTEVTIIDKSFGDVEAAFRNAHSIIDLQLKIGRHSGVPLETRGVIARLETVSDILEMHGAAKVPHRTRDLLAQLLGRSPSSVHLFEGHTGGGFGIRGELYPEDVLACLATLRMGRPIKWIEDRREHLMAANHSREQNHRLRVATDSAGHSLSKTNSFTTRVRIFAPTGRGSWT